MFLDATYCKARVNHRVVSQAIVVAIGVTADGRREVLGMDVGDSEDGAFWTAFLRGLKARTLGGVQLVISDAHSGLKQAIAAVLIGSAWQRCRVHFMRNVLAVVPKGNAETVAAAIRTIFAQPDAEQFDVIAGMLGRQLPKVEAMLRDAKDDLLAFTGFPSQPSQAVRLGAPIAMTLALLCRRASRAVSRFQHRAARTPTTLLAAICSPLPDPPITMPRLPSWATTAAAAMQKPG